MGPDTNSMQITSFEGPDEEVLTLSGNIGRAQVPEFRARLLEAVDRAATDVLIDTHQVTAFDDAALVALTAARKRSRFLRHRIVVLDSENSVVAASLRRNGMHIRMPVYPDATTASRSLATDRETRARLTLRESLLPERPALESTPEAQVDAGGRARAS